MFDFLPALITANVLTTIFYASYSLPTSPIYKNKWKSLVGTIIVAFFGLLMILVHLFKKEK